MDIYCTRPHCAQPLNSFADLDSTKFLKPVQQRHCQNCGMPLILEGRYLPLKLLRQDELSATFLGYDLHTTKLKGCTIDQLWLAPNCPSSQVDIATKIFYREAELLEKLGEHPKIPRLLTSIESIVPESHPYAEQKFFYLVQEYIPGQSLATELLANGAFSQSEVVAVLREVARILEFAHFQSAIHGDIQPSKIIRDLQGKIYLIEFGLLPKLLAETAVAKVELHVGNSNNSGVTVEFAVPKQQLVREFNPDPDLYSLAVTCLTLLIGKDPQYLFNSDINTWQWPRENLQVTDAFAEILDRMLQSLPADRFTSARDVLDALDAQLGVATLSHISVNIPMPIATIPSSPVLSALLLENPYDDPFQIDGDFALAEDSFLQLDRDLFQLDERLFSTKKPPLSRENSALQIIPKAIVEENKNWILGGISTIGLLGLLVIIIPKFIPSTSSTPINNDLISRHSSMGERILLSFEGNRDTEKFKELKRAGVLAIANRNYPEAVAKLRLALAENPNSPETRIYLNNALIGNNKSYTIATAAPISRSIDRAAEMLRGFAQAQAEINQVGGVNEAKIKLQIIDDSDDPREIDNIATAITNRSEILGIVGHNRNDVTMKAAEIYDRNKLAFIAPISTANNLTSSNKPYVFRTNAKSNAISQQLVDRLIKIEHRQKIAIFYVPSVPYNEEFKTEFTNKLVASGGEVVAIFPFSNAASPNAAVPAIFDAEANMKQAYRMGAEAILLLPVGRSNREALQLLKVRANRYPQLSIFGDAALYSKNTLKAGKETQDLILSVPWQELESTPQFSTGASQLWNTQVNWATATSYNAVKALSGAIKTKEPPSRESVAQALASSEFMGASGRFQFTNGEPTARHVLVRVSPTPSTYKYSSRTGYDFVPVDNE
jgi:ABC-type branched-subunit amino acid transport system substrate-binding protein/serine/threonine protein kinase